MNSSGSTPAASPAKTPTFRCDALPDDRRHVREIVESTGFFSPEEVEIAVELVDERLAKGPASGYEFVFAEVGDQTVGYACFGRIPATLQSFDLYWVAVRREHQGHGLGRALVEESERLVRELGGTRIYIDTSGREQYAATRAFYRSLGYREEAVLRDFFAPGDDKVVFSKVLSWGEPTLAKCCT